MKKDIPNKPFYEHSKSERVQIVQHIEAQLRDDLLHNDTAGFLKCFSDTDTYIRKSAYLVCGRLFKTLPALQAVVLERLQELLLHTDEKVRQTAINAAGEIGIIDFPPIEHMMEAGLFDPHHSVRNAVIGSIKKMGEKNPVLVLTFARKYLHHPDKEIRREICHGIELRGRKHPEDILFLLRELEFDKTARVRNTLVHVLGQIAYKKGCLATVVADLKQWKNKELVAAAVAEIIDVHHRYRNFAEMTQEEAREYIDEELRNIRNKA